MRTQMSDLLRGQTGVGQDALGMVSRLLWCRALLDQISRAAAGHRANRLQGPEPWALVGREIAVLQRLGDLRQHSIILDESAGDIRLQQTLEAGGGGLGATRSGMRLRSWDIRSPRPSAPPVLPRKPAPGLICSESVTCSI